MDFGKIQFSPFFQKVVITNIENYKLNLIVRIQSKSQGAEILPAWKANPMLW